MKYCKNLGFVFCIFLLVGKAYPQITETYDDNYLADSLLNHRVAIVKLDSLVKRDTIHSGILKKLNTKESLLKKYQISVDSLSVLDRGSLDSLAMNYGPAIRESLEEKVASYIGPEGLGGEMPGNNHFDKALGIEGYLTEDVVKKHLDFKKMQKDHFLDLSVVQEGKLKIDNLKGKYQELKDSRKQSDGINRHSLKGYSFFRRLELGTMLNISSIDPLQTEVQPILGYRMDKRWVIGAGLIFNGNFDYGKNLRDFDKAISWEGYKSYGLFKIKEGFFLQGEYQKRKRRSSHDLTTNAFSHIIAGGVGTEFKIFRCFWVRSTVLYSISKKEILKAGFQSPFQVSIGIINMK